MKHAVREGVGDRRDGVRRLAELGLPVIVKAAEADRSYERAFFVVTSKEEWEEKGSSLYSWKGALAAACVGAAAVAAAYFYWTKDEPRDGKDKKKKRRNNGKKKNIKATFERME